MGILSGSLGQEFFEFCYNPVGEVNGVQYKSDQLFESIPFLFLEADGHDDLGELHDQLHPLLHHVQAVQAYFQVYTINKF